MKDIKTISTNYNLIPGEWSSFSPECYGADIHEAVPLNTLEDCQSGCKEYAGCKFISFGPGNRCIFKNGKTSIYGCSNCDVNGYCANAGMCDVTAQYCSANFLGPENTGNFLPFSNFVATSMFMSRA